MLSIGDALALLGICAVVIAAIFQLTGGKNVKEKECLLRVKSVCVKIETLKENIAELFNQFNDLNKYLRDKEK